MYLLDTDVCVSLIRRSAPAMVERVRLFPAGALKTSVVTAYELEFGAWRSRDPGRAITIARSLLERFEVLAFGLDAARHAGEIRAELTTRGNIIGASDLLIASHARSAGATLVTGNVREFSRVRGLSIENWTTG